MRFLRPFVFLSFLAILSILFLGTSPSLSGQANAGQARATRTAVADWQTKAGGKMAFDVASVKPNISSDPPHADFPLDVGDSYSPNGGLFKVTGFGLSPYIGFAYKLTPYQTQALQSQLPKWATADRF